MTVAHTHELVFAGTSVVKRYTSWGRGEHVREWSVLNRVHEHAPHLAPRPLAADLDAVPPAITMSAVPGTPLPATPATPQTEALTAALTTLWRTPQRGLAGVDPWTGDLAFARALTARPRPAGGVLASAYDAATAWWHGPDPDLLRSPPPATVLGHRDPNRDNYLWDGRQIHIVDFEDAAVSDPATELALLMEHLSWRDADVGLLRERLPVDGRRLLAARRLWAMFWLHLLLPGGPAVARNPAGTPHHQANRVLRLMS